MSALSNSSTCAPLNIDCDLYLLHCTGEIFTHDRTSRQILINYWHAYGLVSTGGDWVLACQNNQLYYTPGNWIRTLLRNLNRYRPL